MARRTRVDLSEFGELLEPEEAAIPILSRPVRSAVLAWIEEIFAAGDLAAVGLQPRRRAMFHGVPGSGKTTLAHHLCGRLGLRMLEVKSEGIIDCWLGSSARNAGALFDAVAACGEGQDQVVMFFDEFEGLGHDRKMDLGSGATDERNRAIAVLLQRIEKHPGFIIAATNHGAMIDPAIWRRFDLQIELGLPGQEERARILARYLAPYGLPPAELAGLAEAFETAPPALMRRWCEDLKRNLVLGPRLGWSMGRAAVVDRLIATIAPHPETGKPRLWTLGAGDPAIKAMSWPPGLAADLPPEEAAESDQGAEKVTPLFGRPPAHHGPPQPGKTA